MSSLAGMSDVEVVARLNELVAQERRCTVEVLLHLGEVEARKLFLPAACPSMHAYCVEILGFSDQAAYKRIRVARAGRRFPQLLDALADGALHLSGAMALAPHLTDDNVVHVLTLARGKRMPEINCWLRSSLPGLTSHRASSQSRLNPSCPVLPRMRHPRWRGSAPHR